MAKQGTITAPTGADDNLKTLGDSTPVRDTLAGIVRAAFALASAVKLAIINFGVRKAVIVPAATSIASVTGYTSVTLVATLTKDDETKASSPWSAEFPAEPGFADGEAPIEEIIAEVKPSMSVESLVNRLEDITLAEGNVFGANGNEMIVVEDQANNEVRVYAVSTAQAVGAHGAAVALAEDVQYVQTLDAAGGAQFGE